VERVFSYWVSDILDVDIIFSCGDSGKIEWDRKGERVSDHGGCGGIWVGGEEG